MTLESFQNTTVPVYADNQSGVYYGRIRAKTMEISIHRRAIAAKRLTVQYGSETLSLRHRFEPKLSASPFCEACSKMSLAPSRDIHNVDNSACVEQPWSVTLNLGSPTSTGDGPISKPNLYVPYAHPSEGAASAPQWKGCHPEEMAPRLDLYSAHLNIGVITHAAHRALVGKACGNRNFTQIRFEHAHSSGPLDN